MSFLVPESGVSQASLLQHVQLTVGPMTQLSPQYIPLDFPGVSTTHVRGLSLKRYRRMLHSFTDIELSLRSSRDNRVHVSTALRSSILEEHRGI